MTPVKNYQQHLSGAESLVTSYEEIRAGFVSLALERNQIPGLVRVEAVSYTHLTLPTIYSV